MATPKESETEASQLAGDIEMPAQARDATNSRQSHTSRRRRRVGPSKHQLHQLGLYFFTCTIGQRGARRRIEVELQVTAQRLELQRQSYDGSILTFARSTLTRGRVWLLVEMVSLARSLAPLVRQFELTARQRVDSLIHGSYLEKRYGMR